MASAGTGRGCCAVEHGPLQGARRGDQEACSGRGHLDADAGARGGQGRETLHSSDHQYKFVDWWAGGYELLKRGYSEGYHNRKT